MKDEERREENGVAGPSEAMRMTTQRGLAPPGTPAAHPFNTSDIYERNEDGTAKPLARKPDPDTELPADRAEYVSPRTLPPTEAHKTFEMQTVKVKDEVRFPQKGIPTERNLPRVADVVAQVSATPVPAQVHVQAQETPPGPPTAADAVGSFATEAGMYKSPLATADIPPATDANGLPINLLASASPWGASAHTAALGPAAGSLVSGSYAKTGAAPRVIAPRHAAAGWSTRKRVLFAALAIGAPLSVLLMFATSPRTNGTEAAAAATGTLGPIPAPAPTEVAPAAAAAQTAATAAAVPPDATPAVTPPPAAAPPSAAAAPPVTNPELTPKPAATSKPAAAKPGSEGPQPGKPAAAAAPTATPAATPTTAPTIPRPF